MDPSTSFCRPGQPVGDRGNRHGRNGRTRSPLTIARTAALGATAVARRSGEGLFATLFRSWPDAGQWAKCARNRPLLGSWVGGSTRPNAAVRANLALCRNRSFVCRLFDHFVCLSKQRGGSGQTERAGRLQIDHQLECGGLLNREIGGLRTLEDLGDVKRSPLVER